MSVVRAAVGADLMWAPRFYLPVLHARIELRAAAVARWACLHAGCREHRWSSERELLAAHADAETSKGEHVYALVAVVSVPGSLPRTMLLSY